MLVMMMKGSRMTIKSPTQQSPNKRKPSLAQTCWIQKKHAPDFMSPRQLKFILNEKSSRSALQNSIADRQSQNRSSNARSLDFRQKDRKSHIVLPTMQPITKSRRTLIGENLTIPHYAQQDTRALKAALISSGRTISFEAPKENNSHGFFRRFTDKKIFNGKTFLDNRFNMLLKDRLKDSFIMSKKIEQPKFPPTLTFSNEVETGNLEIAAKVNENEYDLYLQIDTNTHGHQNWFHYQVTSSSAVEEVCQFNICNMKRQFKMIHKGQKIFIKEIDDSGNQTGWKTGGSNISIKQNTSQKIARGRIYKLSFQLSLKPKYKYQVAMLPAYTYSQMLNFVDDIHTKYPKHVEVEMLNYSLTGLAIPIVNITDKESSDQDKKVILVSSRIHPGETIASYVAEGFMTKLLDATCPKMVEMLKTTIFKIIPIINPDGVIFGNFRTNYLGIDLNRAFYSDDEVLNPEINSLKSIGRILKNSYGDRFIYFIDLHGHSSQKNIFTYGPYYQYNDPQHYLSKLLPKVMNVKSKYFKYYSCTFTLEDHKKHTARGFFLTELNVMAYTIQSTYSMYDTTEGVEKVLQVGDWLRFGKDLAEGFDSIFKLREMGKSVGHKEIKKILGDQEQEQSALLKKIKHDLKKEIKQPRFTPIKPEIDMDSDCESEQQDLNDEERRDIDKKMLENCLPSFSLPRVVKPAILYPTVTPRLFEVNEEKDEGSFKILYTKRNKYNTLRMVNANSMYANYLKNLDDLERFKPSARNIKLQKKTDV